MKPPLRSWLLVGAASAATSATCTAFARLAHSSWSAVARPAPADPADILLTIVAAAGFVLALWLGLGTVLSALAGLPGATGRACEGIARRVAPAAVRKATALVLGTAMAAAVAPGTAAASGTAAPRHTMAAPVAQAQSPRGNSVPDPGFHPPAASGDVPDPGFRPPAPAPPPVPATMGALEGGSPRASGSVDDRYVVRRGDTLWEVAARHLGPRASATAIAREWPRWYAANRSVIGPDPHHIEPGQLLRPPAATTGSMPR
ncbi:MAG: LysM peptidoglycan-binding domain-containing protein [Dermatophilaceae bacterium]